LEPNVERNKKTFPKHVEKQFVRKLGERPTRRRGEKKKRGKGEGHKRNHAQVKWADTSPWKVEGPNRATRREHRCREEETAGVREGL